MPDESEGYSDFKDKLKAKYFIRDIGAALFTLLDSILSAIGDTEYVAVGHAFRSNVDGLVTTLSFPFDMAADRVIDETFQRLYTQAMLEPKTMQAMLEPQAAAGVDPVAQKARDAMKQFIRTEKGKFDFLKQTSDVLDAAYSSDKVVAANKLLLQGTVLCWSALEVFCRDFFTAYLNKHPDKCRALNKDEDTKKLFDLSKDTLIQHLEGNKYNLSSLMGTILAHRQDFSDFESIRATFRVLFQAASPFEDNLVKSNLTILAARRNLIVHRSGVIDSKYHQHDTTTVVGQSLNLTPEDVRKHLTITVSAATAVLNLVV
jgi:hypothetical protein